MLNSYIQNPTIIIIYQEIGVQNIAKYYFAIDP